MDDITFATLLASRICHDLISPVGAINNGLEILEDETNDDMREQATNLIRNSALNASAKLQFMRLAFGQAGMVSETLGLQEARSLSESLVKHGPVSIDWQAGDVSLDKTVIKLLLNMIFIGAEALPRGGTLRVGVKREGATNLMISAEGAKARLPQKAQEILREGAKVAEVEARESNVLLTRRLAEMTGASIWLSVADDRIEIAATI